MKIQTLIEVIDAAHLTSLIESPFPQRGGIMLVGPPGMLKTTLMRIALEPYPNALMLSDLNVNSLMALRESLIGGRYNTIAFGEFEKIYARKADTAANVEGVMKQLVEEGFTRASFEEQDCITTTARALIIGAMTYNFYSRRISVWRESGFKRRFLWCGLRLKDPDRIMNAIRKWETIDLDGIPRRYARKAISFDVTEEESKRIETMIKGQWEATVYVLLKKIFAVLKWKHKNDKENASKEAFRVLVPFCESINGNVADVEI